MSTAEQTFLRPAETDPARKDRTRGRERRPSIGGAKGRRRFVIAAVTVLVVGIVSLSAVTFSSWWPQLAGLVAGSSWEKQPNTHATAGGEHACGQDHGDCGHGHGNAAEAVTVSLSEQARKNIDLTLAEVEIRNFERTVSMPAMVVDRTGRTELEVAAPMTGVVTRIYPIQGEAVAHGSPLFDLRLTHEDLVEKQSQLLRSLKELDVVKREVSRLEEVTASGAVAGKRLLERQYEQQKLEAGLRAQVEALVLHGLTRKQVELIAEKRELLPTITVFAPTTTPCVSDPGCESVLQITEIAVKPGQQVASGTPLCTLADRCELYIEGKAFEYDAEALHKLAETHASLSAIVDGNGSGSHEVPGLKVLFVNNEIERDSRALKFYLILRNEIVRDAKTPERRRFVGWRYKPGQRVEVLVPIERWEKRIVLPAAAIVQEGVESYVFQQAGEQFSRRSVHVEYQDQRWAVIESDGVLFPGDLVIAKGAYLVHLDLKNKSGGAVDPHAGHHH